ncbi:hypothetical protein [Cerasicoccus maritimus]|uniref:hypothetical protein n=1 Tax=Cerasicoccus maritimus TaxID=490089 RepID=UPI002852976E|nr:hypothetical protein [Cerasicoccus maritimus]
MRPVYLLTFPPIEDESAYRDELVDEVRTEVAQQIETMTGLNQSVKDKGRFENIFEDADLQMAGFAAALRVLTGYRYIDGQDMAAEALRPRRKGDKNVVREIIDYAVQVANEILVPEGLEPWVWSKVHGECRFYLKMLDIESAGNSKLDNFQNFAKAFRVEDYGELMASQKPNDSRLKTAAEFKKTSFDGKFGESSLRALLYALYELQEDTDLDEVMEHLREQVSDYMSERDLLKAYCQFIAAKRQNTAPDEASAARSLLLAIRNEGIA